MPRMQSDVDSYVDVPFLVPGEPPVPYRYPRTGPLSARDDRNGRGVVHLGRSVADAVDSRKALASAAEKHGLDSPSLWFREIERERKNRRTSGYL